MSTIVAAEIGMAHDGHLERVEEYARVAKACGVDVLKMQMHSEHESSPLEQWRVPPASGESRLEYWRRTQWTPDQWRAVIQIAHDHGLRCVIAPFSRHAIHVLAQIETMDGWKVPSGLVSDPEALRMIACDGRQVWLSTGLSTANEIRDAFTTLAHDDRCGPITLLNCTSSYPCAPEWSGLGWLRRDIWIEIDATGEHDNVSGYGWSDHTGDPALIYAAVGLGASVVEVHLELGTESTPDTSASWTPDRLTELVKGIRRIEVGLQSTDKDAIAKQTAHLRPYYAYTLHEGRVAKHQGRGEPIR